MKHGYISTALAGSLGVTVVIAGGRMDLVKYPAGY